MNTPTSENITLNAIVMDDDVRAFWEPRLASTHPDVAKQVVRLFRDYPESIPAWTQLQRKKEQAMRDQDDALWNEIIAKEAKLLERVTS